MRIVPSIWISFLSRGLRYFTGYLCGALVLFFILAGPIHSTFALYPHGANTDAYIRGVVSQNLDELPEQTLYLVATAYSSTPDQTDDTPCIAARGFDLCAHDTEDVVATNLLPIGTKLRFPVLDPDTIYTVVDRMHERYNARIDFWKRTREAAERFGIRVVKVEVLK